MKLSKMIWFNAVIAAFCLFSGIYCLCHGNILIGILDIALAAANIYCVLSYIAAWWETSEKVQQKFKFRCKYCGYYNVPSFWRWLFVPHIGSKRYLKCEACGERHFMRRK